MKIIALLMVLLVMGCEAHLVKKEYWSADQVVRENSRDEKCTSSEAEVQPIEIRNKILSNSILWLPIIPTPWREFKYEPTTKVHIKYRDHSHICEEGDVVIVSGMESITPLYSVKTKSESGIAMCFYSFEYRPRDINKSGSSLIINKYSGCGSGKYILTPKVETKYENHFSPW